MDETLQGRTERGLLLEVCAHSTVHNTTPVPGSNQMPTRAHCMSPAAISPMCATGAPHPSQCLVLLCCCFVRWTPHQPQMLLPLPLQLLQQAT